MAVRQPLLKICGFTQAHQAASVAAMGVDAIGVIGVQGSPRFVPTEQRKALFQAASTASPTCAGVLVVANPSDGDLAALDPHWGHQVVQLHGGESPERCHDLRLRLGCGIWKALRIRGPGDLAAAAAYGGAVDALLLDAWVPDQLGGTGHRIPIEWLEGWQCALPWWLAGGIRPDRVGAVLARLSPHGLDASSGVERAPGVKDLALVAQLVAAVRSSSENQGSLR